LQPPCPESGKYTASKSKSYYNPIKRKMPVRRFNRRALSI
jgi:hypothetical protein